MDRVALLLLLLLLIIIYIVLNKIPSWINPVVCIAMDKDIPNIPTRISITIPNRHTVLAILEGPEIGI
jgi:hypothetical protein